MSVFLSAADLRELTGYVKPSKQIAWLERNAIPHHVNAAGRPVVLASLTGKTPVASVQLGPVR